MRARPVTGRTPAQWPRQQTGEQNGASERIATSCVPCGRGALQTLHSPRPSYIAPSLCSGNYNRRRGFSEEIDRGKTALLGR